jgi:hypothetical protein
MKRVICLTGFLLFGAYTILAQDEGVIKKRERIDRSKSVFIGGGGSFTFGDNIGDYSLGFNIEAGFVKRLNRVLSIGPSISYLRFDYDPEQTQTEYIGNNDISIAWYSQQYDTWGEKYPITEGNTYDYRYLLSLEGGDLSLISLALNIKLNFIPITDNTKISVYGFAKPFISISNRDAVTGSGVREVWESYEDRNGTLTNESDDLLYYYQGDNTWHPDGYVEAWSSEGSDGYPALAKESSVTGGIFVGPGIEFVPANAISFYFQAAVGYTFPVSYISTESYDNTVASYVDEEFPIVKKGFPSLNLQFGVSFNF